VESFDIIVLGAGSAGVSAALRAADQGSKVCIVEQEKIGGSCIHKGIYPLKIGLVVLLSKKRLVVRVFIKAYTHLRLALTY